MLISERKLKKWRKEALVTKNFPEGESPMIKVVFENTEFRRQILQLTQEFLDQHLMKK